uniref:P2X purinoceptor 4-like isoform X1 n=1 Tax=Myxine glutinosa TaxID=7769 RepID=UPI00358E7C71
MPCDWLCSYDTQRFVHIRSTSAACLQYLLQIAVVAYVIGWVIIYRHGYQDMEVPVSTVTSKLKGVAFYRDNDSSSSGGVSVWDAADYVIPPEEENAFFIVTNFIPTANQSRSTCPSTAQCELPQDCPKTEMDPEGVGVFTGKCINTSCEIHSWCPLEKEEVPPKPPKLKGAENLTALIKISVYFPRFNISRRNIPDDANTTWMKSCRFSTKNNTCPIFRLGDMVAAAGQDFETLATQGGVIGIRVAWFCDFDYRVSLCRPTYTFRRLDNPSRQSTISPGYNFRYAIYHNQNERTLIKAYGIRFEIQVYGKARKFGIVPTVLNIASGIALLGGVTIICDIFVIYCLGHRHLYLDKKFKHVDEGSNDQK